jgi:hypothetical protein
LKTIAPHKNSGAVSGRVPDNTLSYIRKETPSMDENTNGKNCWFCEKELASGSHSYEKKMRKKVGGQRNVREATKTTYFDEKTVRIPRCENCAKIHMFNRVAFLVSVFISLTLSCLIFYYQISINSEIIVQNDTATLIVIAVLIVGLPLAFGVGLARLIARIRFRDVLAGKKMKSDYEITINKYPEVARLRKQGYLH